MSDNVFSQSSRTRLCLASYASFKRDTACICCCGPCRGVVICLERGADLHMAQLIPLQLTVSCFSKIQIGFYLSGTGPPG